MARGTKIILTLRYLICRQHQGTYPGSLKWYAQLNFRAPDGVVEGSKMEGAIRSRTVDGFGGWESGSKEEGFAVSRVVFDQI